MPRFEVTRKNLKVDDTLETVDFDVRRFSVVSLQAALQTDSPAWGATEIKLLMSNEVDPKTEKALADAVFHLLKPDPVVLTTSDRMSHDLSVRGVAILRVTASVASGIAGTSVRLHLFGMEER